VQSNSGRYRGINIILQTNKATDTDLKVIERLQQAGWKRGDTLFYQQEYALSSE